MVHKYIVKDNKKITPSVQLLTLKLADGEDPLLYQPGQYAAIGMRDRMRPTVMRCFSITTSPTNQQYLQFSMRVQGKFTSAVNRLKPGDETAVRGPFGGFVFNQNLHQDAVFFAGGIGIAPFISMLRYATECRLTNKLHLVYSVRNQDDVAFYKELEQLQSQNPHLTITYVVAEGPTNHMVGSRVMTGRVDSSNINQLKLDYNEQTFFICGPPPYMKAMDSLLRQHGASSSQIMTEAFSQGSHKQTGKIRSWPFNMYALSGVALLVGGFYIVASDLYKTLPKLQEQARLNTAQQENSGSNSSSVTTLAPQVDTNLNQDTIVQDQTSSNTQSSSSSSASTQTTAPTVTPSPTVTSPSTPTQTAVS